MRAYSRKLWWLVGITLLAAAVRLQALFANRFHADEALFAGWARLVAVWRDPLLQTQAIDKPPLLFYLQATAYPLFGPVEWAARLPGLVASVLVIPLSAVLAWRVSGQRIAAVIAALFLALIPLEIQFSATAFIDPVMALFLLAACVCVSLGRPSLAGLFFGLAVATKYQAWLFFPLLVVLVPSNGWSLQSGLRWLAGFTPVLLLLTGWAAARPEGIHLWSQQMRNFGGVRLAWSWELWPRLLAWTRLWLLSLGLPFAAITLVVILVVAILWIASDKPSITPHPITPIAGWLLLFLFGYSLLHWLLAVPVWDRYLLPLMPFLAVLTGVGIGRLWALLSGRSRTVLVGVLFSMTLLHAPWVSSARNGILPVGGQPAADYGAADIGQYLADAPYGTVLYDHWYGWHWRYHLFDRGVYVSWFPHTQALVEDLRVFHQGSAATAAARYVVLPATAVARPVIRVVENAGFRLRPVYQATGMVLYQVEDGHP